MTQAAIGYLRRQYLCVLRRCASNNIVMSAAAGLAVGAGLTGGAAMAQGITPDGRTQTQLSVNGSVTDITTRTVQGANAFNSFTTFNVNAGSTVNLHLPGPDQQPAQPGARRALLHQRSAQRLPERSDWAATSSSSTRTA